MKDLTRCLAISKHWRQSILSSIMLRRKLFLYPDPKKEYYSIQSSVLLREKSATSRSIHELHPILMPYSNPCTRIYLEVNEIPHKSLRTVHPATLLFQPPLDRIQVDCAKHEALIVLTRTDGVTFGDIIKGLDKLCTRRLQDEGNGHTCSFLHCRALASNAEAVIDAREERAKAEASAGLE
jgi:hypothetical protein